MVDLDDDIAIVVLGFEHEATSRPPE